MNPTRKARSVSRAATKKLRHWVVEISRPNVSRVYGEIVCNLGETRTEEIFNNGSTIVVRTRDYLIDVLDWPFDSEPAVDDVIKDADGVFKITDESGEGAWRWSGRDRATYRIHTVESER